MNMFEELPRSTKFLYAWVATAAISLLLILVIGDPILLALIWFPVMCLAPLVVMVLANKCWFLQCVCWFKKDHHVIKCIDMHKDCYYTIASANAEGQLIAPVYWFNDIGQLILRPNGAVDPLCHSWYIYFWEFVDRENKTMMHLQYPEFRSISDYLKMEEHEFWDAHIKAVDSLR